MRIHFTAITLLAVLLGVVGCAPPWRGEECNFDVVTLTVYDTDLRNRIPLDSLGYTAIRQVERGKVIDRSEWGEVDELTFRRLDPQYNMILPIDPELGQSTFVFEHPSGNDTLIVQYTSRLGNDRRGGCGYSFLIENPTASFRGGPFEELSNFNHPRVVGEVEVQQ